MDELNNSVDNKIFVEGPIKNLETYYNNISNKLKGLTYTIEPVINLSLINLLETNAKFKKQKCSIFYNNETISFEFVYFVQSWVVENVPQEAIQKDATYILNNLNKIPNIKINKCSINTETGCLVVSGTL